MIYRLVGGVVTGLALCMEPSVVRAQQMAVERRETTVSRDALARPVSVDLREVTLERAVKALALSANVRIQYQKEVVASVRTPVTLQVKQAALGSVLATILHGTGLHAEPLLPDVIDIKRDEDARNATRPSGIIVGTIRDAKTKQPVTNAVVTLAGTKISARAAEDGTYRLTNVPAGDYVLTVRRLGFAVVHQSVTVKDATVTLDVETSAAATPLDDVVTTVTGPQRRMEIANSIGMIKADPLVKEAPILTLSQLLSSRIPGLSVLQGQGTVGGDVKLSIRGVSSIMQSSEPIVILDGIRYDSRSASVQGLTSGITEAVSPLNDLNPNDIESIEVVKGPSAATLYGTDASNGVIVITTKRGKVGPARFNVYGSRDYSEIPSGNLGRGDKYYGWGHWTLPWTTDTTSSCTLQLMANGNCMQDSVTHRNAPYDEQFSFYKPSQSWTSGANVSGGSDKFRYYLGGNYNDVLGTVTVPDTVVKLMRILGKPIPASFLRPNSQTMTSLSANAAASPSTVFEMTVGGSYTRANTHAIQATYEPAAKLAGGGDAAPRDAIESALKWGQLTSVEDNDRYNGNLSAWFRPGSWFSASSTVGFDNATRNHLDAFPVDPQNTAYGTTGYVKDIRARSAGLSGSFRATATYRRSWISFQTSAGTQYNRRTSDIVGLEAFDLIPGTASVRFAATTFPTQDYDQSVTLGSYVDELIGVNDRLFLNAAVRKDGATGFGDGYKSAAYPKFGASWVVSREPWLPRIPVLDEVRVRVAYGVAGNQARATAKLPSLSITTWDRARGNYLEVTSIGNPQLRPERSSELETGLDLNGLNSRLNVGLTWYQRRTKDMIVSRLLPSGFGSINSNLGLVTGSGVEASVTATLIDTRDVSFAATINHSKRGTLLKDLGDVLPSKSSFGGYVEGYPLGARFARLPISYVDQNDDGLLAESEIKFSDTAVYVGVTEAPVRQTMTLNVGLVQQRVRLSSTFDRERGRTDIAGGGCARCREAFDRTTSLEDQFNLAKDTYGMPLQSDFVRWREVTMTVTVPQIVTRALRTKTATVALSARNLWQWTHFKGGDPESAPVSGAPTYRDRATSIPQAKTWVLRCDLGL